MQPLLLNDGSPPPSANMRNWMAELGERLVANGYPIIPILPGSKCPGRFTRGKWEAYPGWTRHCDRPTKPFEVGIWKTWPGCAIGCSGGVVTGFDIDVTDADAAIEIENFAFAELGQTPALRIGQQPKRLLVYRTRQPFASIKKHPLEALCRGSQFVAYAQHPATGQPYQWPVEDLADLAMSDLPMVTEDQMRRFLDEAFKLVPQELRRRTLGPDRSADHYYSGGDLRGTPEAVSSAMGYIPNDDVHYDDWVRIGQAIKGAIGDQGWTLFDAWSQRSGKYEIKETARAWSSFNPRNLGAGTIYFFAGEYGWFPEHDLILNGAVADAVKSVPVGSIRLSAPVTQQEPEKGTQTPISTQPGTEPEHDLDKLIADAPGLLGEMTRWITGSALIPQPLMALGASLCALGMIMGRRYRLSGPDTRSNIYILALADSGAGKDHARRCIDRSLRAAGLEAHIGGEQIKSGSGFMAAITEQPRKLYQVDEFGHFIKAVLDPKSHSYHLREIMTHLTMLWSRAADIIPGAEYADRSLKAPRNIIEPCVCLYGMTVPQTFWGALQSGQLGDGSLARFLVFQSPESHPDERDEPPDVTVGIEPIVAGMKALDEGLQSTGKGNLAAIKMVATVPLDDAAKEADRALRAEHLVMRRAYEGTAYSGIVARFREHIRRIALIAAAAETPEAPVCRAHHFRWAAELVRHCQSTILSQAERFVADNEYERMAKSVLDVIRQHGTMTERELSRKIRTMDIAQRTKIIAHLQQGGFVHVVTSMPAGGVGRPSFRVSIATDETDNGRRPK